jgi:hypothetical protein
VEFTLYYRGHLKANGGPKDKHRLRQHFHGQIKELWKQSPLVKHRGLLDPEGGSVRVGELIEIDEINEDRLTVVRTVGAYKFASVVSSTLDLVADLSITLLRPEPPGAM